MFYEGKLGAMVKVLLLSQVLLLQNIFIVEASIASGKAKSSVHNNEIPKEPSSNQISVKEEEKLKSESDQLYYLPMQTVFGETNTATRAGGFSTSPPPHISIDPASIQSNYQESTKVFDKDSSLKIKYYSGPYQSQCVSETPVIELESRFLLPSREIIKESVIMSGHLEIASKTSTVDEVSDVDNVASKPSIALEGTILHSQSIRDL